ncbi:hypothetical protein [Desulfosporosinus fructosivorans]|uniref:hypothetical protein n=1 Tax=Desulfosporosinus fructosivorans TaxID=2018669 RepID=UPI00130DBFFB|nr:hypothetical protein [Desulfosporosinus fructosivorans]
MENDDLNVQKESPVDYQTMFPGYEKHVYKSAFANELSPPDKLPGAPCHSPLE